VARLTKTEAVQLLAVETVTATTDAKGQALVLHPRSGDGTQLVALADRLGLASAAGPLSARVYDADGRPWLVALEIEGGEFHGKDTARVTLRATGLRLDRDHRKAERTPVNSSARLTAVGCHHVRDGEVVLAELLDVADGGVAFTTRSVLRVNDSLILKARFFATELEAEVRVVRVVDRGPDFQVGACFVAITPAQRQALRDLTDYRSKASSTAGLVRELLGQPTAERLPAAADAAGPSLWRRVLRRSA
jgi:PilZ domain-containing protein